MLCCVSFRKAIQLQIYRFFFYILSYHRLLYDIEYSFLCYKAGLLLVICFIHTSVCILPTKVHLVKAMVFPVVMY